MSNITRIIRVLVLKFQILYYRIKFLFVTLLIAYNPLRGRQTVISLKSTWIGISILLLYRAQNLSSISRSLHQLDNLEQIFKKLIISKICFNRFWGNLIPKVLYRYIISVCSFKTIAEILKQSELPQPFKKNPKSHKISNQWSIPMKIVTTKGATSSLVFPISFSIVHWY